MANGTLTALTRDDYTNAYLRKLRMRNPNAKTGPDETDYVDAVTLADQLLYASNDAKVIAGGISLQDATGEALDYMGRPVEEGGLGVPRPEADGASGAVVIETTASGTTIVNGATLRTAGGVEYSVVLAGGDSGVRSDNQTVAIVCSEDGPQTNLAPGAKLTWDSPPAGCYANATVYEQADGTGLTGGRERMEDDDYRALLAEAKANPAGGGNEAELQLFIQDARAHGVSVEKAFTYSAVLGLGSIGFTFTMRADSATASRLPSSDQLNIVAAYLAGKVSATEGLFKTSIANDDMQLVFRIRWITSGWTNSVAFPPYMAAGSRYIIGGIATSATAFTIDTEDSVYVGRAAPQAGNVLALFDAIHSTFVRKTVKTVSGTGPWVVTIETAANSSDLGYQPAIGQLVSPWANSLADIAELVRKHMASMGPGEITAAPPSDGMRRRRYPRPSSTVWPSDMDGRLLSQINAHIAVDRATHEDGADYTATIGSAALVYLANLTDLGVLPL